MTFLRELLAVILGVFIAIGVMFLILLVFVSASASAFGDDKKVLVKNNSRGSLPYVNIIYPLNLTYPFNVSICLASCPDDEKWGVS